jgi:hypothetical protein
MVTISLNNVIEKIGQNALIAGPKRYTAKGRRGMAGRSIGIGSVMCAGGVGEWRLSDDKW